MEKWFQYALMALGFPQSMNKRVFDSSGGPVLQYKYVMDPSINYTFGGLSKCSDMRLSENGLSLNPLMYPHSLSLEIAIIWSIQQKIHHVWTQSGYVWICFPLVTYNLQ